MPPVFLRRNSVLVVGDLMQSCCFILGISFDPPCLANMCWVNPLCMVHNLPWSFSAFLSCFPMYLRYAFFNENVSSPNSSWGS